jgi:two-component system, OmpR family, response regulator CpxR
LKQISSNAREHTRSILLIDDDVGLCILIAEFFETHNFRVDKIHDGGCGLAQAFEAKHDLVLLDVMLPVLDGFQVLRQLRQRCATPVILLTARGGYEDRIAGLDGGADDYIPKPFRPHELLARVRAVLRRSEQPRTSVGLPVTVGDLVLNPQTREVRKAKIPVTVTSFEFDILEALMRSAGRVVSRDELASVLYHRESTPFERSIDVHVGHLRRKLETGGRPLIRSIRGVGYQLVAAGEPSE